MFWTFSDPCWKEKKVGITGGATPFAVEDDGEKRQWLSGCRGKGRRCVCEIWLWDEPMGFPLRMSCGP